MNGQMSRSGQNVARHFSRSRTPTYVGEGGHLGVEVAGITKLDSCSSVARFRVALSRGAAAMPHLVDTLQAVASELIFIDDTQPRQPNCDAHVVIATEHVPPLPCALGIRVVVTDIDETTIRHAMETGVGALITPNISIEELRAVLTAATHGYYPIPRHLAQVMASRLEAPKPQTLSRRDLTILRHLAQGGTMIELAQELGCSERHARRHVRALWNTMGVHGRAQGLVAAARRGLLEDLDRSIDQPTDEPPRLHPIR